MTIDINDSKIDMTPELFNLLVATINLLETKDQSTTSLYDKAMSNEATSQDILDYIISELEDLSTLNLMNTQFELDASGVSGYIHTIPIKQDKDVNSDK